MVLVSMTDCNELLTAVHLLESVSNICTAAEQ